MDRNVTGWISRESNTCSSNRAFQHACFAGLSAFQHAQASPSLLSTSACHRWSGGSVLEALNSCSTVDSRLRGNDVGEGLGVPAEPERGLIQADSVLLRV